jgi:alkylhydroperoxidase/carboxymuconolactone decarboxylase family protein YurZ
MSDEIALRKDAEEGARAQGLLNSPVFQKAFDEYERAMIEAWKASPPTAYDARERAWLAISIAAQVRKTIETTAANGRMAQAAIDQLMNGVKDG